MSTLTSQSNVASLTAEDLAILSRQPHALQVIQMWGDQRDAEAMALCDQFSNGHAESTAERHAYLAFGKDIRS